MLGFNNALGRLRTVELVQGRGDLRADENLSLLRLGIAQQIRFLKAPIGPDIGIRPLPAFYLS